jgi:hypothetical protein
VPFHPGATGLDHVVPSPNASAYVDMKQSERDDPRREVSDWERRKHLLAF